MFHCKFRNGALTGLRYVTWPSPLKNCDLPASE
jgi:hypothetical protein